MDNFNVGIGGHPTDRSAETKTMILIAIKYRDVQLVDWPLQVALRIVARLFFAFAFAFAGAGKLIQRFLNESSTKSYVALLVELEQLG